ncbi:putative lipid II flippase FtsW [Patescibacteria group bacterium]|nr:putative lipid II flippase FtsW [Patescibacteria group bacterium]
MTLPRHGIDKTFLSLVLGISIFGLLILTSASGPEGYEQFGDSYYFVKHQIVNGWIPGMIAFIFGIYFPSKLLKKWALPLLGVTLLFLVLVFIPGIGTDLGTFAHSWINIAGFSFQPSEFAKLTILIYLASWLATHKETITDFKQGLLPFLAILGLLGLLIFLQPDLGTLSIIFASSFMVYFVAGGKMSHIVGLGALAATLFGLAIKLSPYRFTRFTTFLHPELDPQGIGYQINQALLAVGSGGIFGRGYGHSLQKFQYLPEVIGDSIFAIMSEELGFVLTVLFILVYIWMIVRGLGIAQEASDTFSRLLVVGIISWFGLQAFVNIGSMVGIMPITGVPLPFLSYGGTSLVVSFLAAGIVLNISKK